MGLRRKVKEVSPTIEEAIEEFVQSRKNRNLSGKSITWYERRNRYLLADMLDKPLVELSLRDVEQRLGAVLDRASAITRNGYMRAVKVFLYWAERKNFELSLNPHQLEKAVEPKRNPPCFTHEQIVDLLSAPDQSDFCGLRDYAFMALMLGTGIRVSEMIGLRTSNVYLPKAQAPGVPEGMVEVIGKGDKQRRIALDENCQRVLKRYLRARELALSEVGLKSDALFPSRLGRHMSYRVVLDKFRKYGRQAGIENVRLSPHTTRHTFATMYMRDGGQLHHLRLILGHTTLTMSQRYAHLEDRDAFNETRTCNPLARLNLR
ncbi:MAG: tyrosine-type recombinase/integrase [Armatimonadia bacterium]